MSFDIVRGIISKPSQTNQLVDAITNYMSSSKDSGTLYLGYPLTASADSKVTIDAMLLTEAHGMIVFIFQEHGASVNELKDEQDALYYHLDFYLKKYSSLRNRRSTVVTPIVITVLVDKMDGEEREDDYYFVQMGELCNEIENLPKFDRKYYKPLCEALQKVTNIRPAKKRDNVVKENSKGWVIKEIEKEIANLDEWQKKAALEVPNGPQRIRGLAGTGKTIVLALKAAYLHTQYPKWNILVTFYTRSLKQQYEELVEKFVSDFSGDKPDWNRLKILHAWGSRAEDGVYFRLTQAYHAPVHSFTSAKSKYGRNNPFKGMCEELLTYSDINDSLNKFDAILIDEAQDLPAAFFQLIYKYCKTPKRIIWAYDELQNLSDLEMPSITEMFGTDEEGNSLINIDNVPNEPQRDIILPVCYRNPPWTLAMAHALGFGVYRNKSNLPIQTFDKPNMWREIGYSVVSGSLVNGRKVKIERKPGDNPEYFSKLLSREDSIQAIAFEEKEKQYAWVAQEIYKNITEDELDPDDILVVLPEAYTSKTEYVNFARYLRAKGIDSILAGVNSSQDTFRTQGYVTCSGIYRAKGNESPMVYIINSEYCAEGTELVKLRNVLFTAITRSRAWVRVCGVGPLFKMLNKEFKECAVKEFCLEFKCPTQKEMEQIRKLNRERTEEERANEIKARNNIGELISMIERGEIDKDTMPELEVLLNTLKKNG
uniref:DEAD/DEAH box helicase n=1 Tax=Agathobacter sp. TaxID=2021311 RepID=UPI004057C657